MPGTDSMLDTVEPCPCGVVLGGDGHAPIPRRFAHVLARANTGGLRAVHVSRGGKHPQARWRAEAEHGKEVVDLMNGRLFLFVSGWSSLRRPFTCEL